MNLKDLGRDAVLVDNFKEKIPTKYINIVDNLLKLNGVIYGGFVRDVLCGEVPNDVDVMTYIHDYDNIENYLKTQGYIREYRDYDVTGDMYDMIHSKFTKPSESIVIDVFSTHNLVCLADPDADVNMIQWDGTYLALWCGVLDEIDTETAIDHAKNKEFVRLSDDDYRIHKLLDKNWMLLYDKLLV